MNIPRSRIVGRARQAVGVYLDRRRASSPALQHRDGYLASLNGDVRK